MGLSEELRYDKHVMDNIWYPSKSELIGRCGGDEKTRMTTENRQKLLSLLLVLFGYCFLLYNIFID